MQDEVEHKVVLVVEGAAKMTPRLLAKAMKKAVGLGTGTAKLGWKGVKAPVQLYKHSVNKERHGKMTVKQLSRQRGGDMSQIEVAADNIGSFVPIAKKYGIDFALRKVKATGENEKDTYQIFFKGVDKDTIERAFTEYIAKYDMKRQKKQDRKQPARDSKVKKQSKEKPQKKKRTKGRERENRPSLLKRLAQKKREVEDQRRDRQHAPQELSR